MTGDFEGADARELAAKYWEMAAREDPAAMAKYLDPERYVIREHHQVIATALASLGKDYDRLLVTCPPQVGKSTLVSEALPFWWLTQRPSQRVVVASYAAQLAVDKARAVRRHVEDQGGKFGLHLAKGEGAVFHWSTTTGGGMRAVGVGGSLTGFRADLAIVDDPHKDRAEADSLRMRDLVWDWWSSVLLSRLRPGAPVCLTLTRWHEDDLAGRVLEKEPDRWHVVHLPALSTQLGDPLGRRPGDPLTHPAIEDEDTEALLKHWRDKKATSTPRDWGALYQGDPKPIEGALVTQEVMARQRDFGYEGVSVVRAAVAVDPSGGGRDEAGVIGGFLGSDGRVYVTHDETAAMSSDEWTRKAAIMAAEIGASVVFIERQYGGDMAPKLLEIAWESLKAQGRIPAGALKPYISQQTAKIGKWQRAEIMAQYWIDDRVRTGRYLPEVESEWCSYRFGSSKSPGRIDACVYLFGGLNPTAGGDAGRNSISTATGVSRSRAALMPVNSGRVAAIDVPRGGPAAVWPLIRRKRV